MRAPFLLFLALSFSFPATVALAEHKDPLNRALVSSDEELAAALKLSRQFPLAKRLSAIYKNRALTGPEKEGAIQEVIRQEDARIDGWLEERLQGKPLFDCVLPKDLSKSPPLTFHADTHFKQTERQQEMIDRSNSADPKEKIRLLVEAAEYGDRDSVLAWGQDRKFKNLAYPNVQGLDSNEAIALAFWVDYLQKGMGMEHLSKNPRATAAEKEKHQSDVIYARIDAMEYLVFQYDIRKAFSTIKTDIPGSKLRDLFDRVRQTKPVTDPEKTFDKLQEFIDATTVLDEAGWRPFSKEVLDHFYKKTLGEEKWEAAKPQLTSLLDLGHDINNLVLWMSVIGEERSVAWVIHIAKEYCESLQDGIPRYISVGLHHLPTTQRLLRKAAPTLRMETELPKGSLLELKDDFKELLDAFSVR